MPQGDIVGFSSTLLLVPIGFLLGYYFWITVWVPRLLLTLRARHWVTTYAVGLAVDSSRVWPETTLMFIQFVGLLSLIVWVTSLASEKIFLLYAIVSKKVAAIFSTTRGENTLQDYLEGRGVLFFHPTAVDLTLRTEKFLDTLPGWIQYRPRLVSRLRPYLVNYLSGTFVPPTEGV